MSAFDKYLHSVITRGTHEAVEDGSATIEAQHLLLAIADHEGTAAHDVLTSVGLDHQAIREALDKEFEHSLSAAGVSLADFDLPRPSKDPTRSVSMGTSGKLALERAFASVARKKDLRSGHLLLGIFQAEVGTVPRALALAGIDRADLMERVQSTLTNHTD
ncbi:Clp protease N-terminal domain-containing protein [Nonomuraea africana]|uniref:D-alanyl-D-alanine carboxypeptidase n=1 Tax=Nonomuraea africana TaxID=46171 RepID=A0ABR9KUU5_9ACTN|nr:Clp protease N-terminal domain-containing protein [Nonomuraea africana]MBE1565287.1 D-alanyl-D-alanine carboxypeptidase [Nonomuraea africana]